MALGALRFGIFLFVAGILSFFFTHSIVGVSVLTGIGFALFVIGFIAYGLESSGDINLS